MNTHTPKLSLFFLWIFLICNSSDPVRAQQTDDIDPDDIIDLNSGNSEAISELLNQPVLKNYQLDLNSASLQQIISLPHLSESDGQKIWQYLQEHRPLISVYELQSAPGIDLSALRKILPFVTIINPGSRINIRSLNKDSDKSIVIRWSKNYPVDPQFNIPDSVPSAFLGSPDRVFVRLKYKVPGKFSTGLIAEKDAGEDWFNKKTIPGIDYLSFHLSIDNPVKNINYLIIGDYTLNLGQGLIADNAFSVRRSFQFGMLVRNNQILRPFQSVQENQMYRGLATKWTYGKHFSGILFYSANKIDANIVAGDTLDQSNDITQFTSIQLGGLHRSQSELDDKDAIFIQHAGTNLQYSKRNLQIGTNVVYSLQDAVRQTNQTNIIPTPSQLRQQFALSIYHQYVATKYTIFGELAHFQGGSTALLQGMLFNLSKHAEGLLQYRYLTEDMRFALSRTTIINEFRGNEQGIIFGLQLRPIKKISLGVFAEQLKRPGLTLRLPLPSKQIAYTIRLQYAVRKQWTAYIQYRYTSDQERSILENAPRESSLKQIANHQLRCNFDFKINHIWNWRARLEYHLHDESGILNSGYALALDLHFKTIDNPFSGNLRLALFDANQFETRIYMYENDVLYSYSLPFYAGKGVRSYLGLRYSILKNTSLETRIGCIYFYPDSYNLSRDTNRKSAYQSDIKIQLRYKF